MKTHELAKSLDVLVKILKKAENQDVECFDLRKNTTQSYEGVLNSGNAAGALAMLAALAKLNKPGLIELINGLNLKVIVKATDSRRDLLDRILKHINDNKDVHRGIVEQARNPQAGTSPELMQALSILLKS